MTAQGKDSSGNSEREITRLVSSAETEGEPVGIGGHRDATRFAVGMQLDVSTDPQVPSCTWPVTMHNISQGGFAFWSKRQLRVGSVLWVREFSADNSKPWIGAEVTHCTVGIRGYLVGGRFAVKSSA
jgi:hypothetical protein